MRIQLQLVREPIPLARTWDPAESGAAGALAEFTGLVRAEENHQTIAALEYEAYDPMALNVMRQILEALAQKHPCHAAQVIHRLGVVPVGAAAIYVGVTARHRAEAFAVLTEFMDRLKQDVPIWKTRALTAEELKRCQP